MTTATTKQPTIKPHSCISSHEKATDMTAECNKHQELHPAQSRY